MMSTLPVLAASRRRARAGRRLLLDQVLEYALDRLGLALQLLRQGQHGAVFAPGGAGQDYELGVGELAHDVLLVWGDPVPPGRTVTLPSPTRSSPVGDQKIASLPRRRSHCDRAGVDSGHGEGFRRN